MQLPRQRREACLLVRVAGYCQIVALLMLLSIFEDQAVDNALDLEGLKLEV